MIYIIADDEGKIKVISLEPIESAIEYSREVPDDLFFRFSLGKYKFLEGEVIEVNGWEMPVIEEF